MKKGGEKRSGRRAPLSTPSHAALLPSVSHLIAVSTGLVREHGNKVVDVLELSCAASAHLDGRKECNCDFSGQ